MPEIPHIQKIAADVAAESGHVKALADFLQLYAGHGELSDLYKHAGYDPSESHEFNAQKIIAHAHCFDNWLAFESFNDLLRDETSLVGRFEKAADAIAAGDEGLLKEMLLQNPVLIAMRSVRNHHSTLLNYTGANGVESFRQKTPVNAVKIIGILLSAGAETDARGDMYRGTTTLGLVATSVHPVITGVQQEMMDILIRHGADQNHAVASDYTDGSLILACLHNGRYEPIHYLATQGASINLEAAGGLGDLKKVKSYFNDEDGLVEKTMEPARDGCLVWACMYGHTDVINYLLDSGMNVNIRWNGTTPLHSAAFGGQVAIAQMLLAKGADMEALNEHDGTVLGTTLWCLYNARGPAHIQIMEMLIAAGAKVKEGWQVYINEQRHESGH